MRMPNITTKVGSMHETVRRHLTKAIQIYGGDSTALQSGQSRLAEAYQKDWGAENSRSLQQPTDNSMVLNHPSSSCRGSNGLVALAEIADMRLQNETSGQLGDIFETYNDETVNMQARTAPSFGTAPAATVTHQALGPGTAENLQPAWWQGADSCPVSGSLCQDIPLDSAPSLPLDQLAQAQLAPSDGTMDYWDGWRQPLFDEFVHDIGE